MGGAAIASVALGQYTSVLGTVNQSDFGFGPAPGSARPILGIGVGSSRPAFRMVEASRDELILAVGLTPGVAYQITDDGTVTAEISGQGSEGLDGNGTV